MEDSKMFSYEEDIDNIIDLGENRYDNAREMFAYFQLDND